MHVGADDDSGLVHMGIGTAADVHDITVARRCCTAKKLMCTLMPGIRVSKSVVRLTQFVGMLQ